MLRRQTFWLARRTPHSNPSIEGLIKAYRPAADALRAEGMALLAPFVRSQADARIKELVKAGAPKALATELAALRPLMTVSNLSDLGRRVRWDVVAVARIYQAVGAAFGFDRLRGAAGAMAGAGETYERLAVRRLIEEMLAEQLSVTAVVIAFSGADQAGSDTAAAKAAVQSWAAMRREEVRAARQTIQEIEASPGGWSFAKLTIVNAALETLVKAAKETD